MSDNGLFIQAQHSYQSQKESYTGSLMCLKLRVIRAANPLKERYDNEKKLGKKKQSQSSYQNATDLTVDLP